MQEVQERLGVEQRCENFRMSLNVVLRVKKKKWWVFEDFNDTFYRFIKFLRWLSMIAMVLNFKTSLESSCVQKLHSEFFLLNSEYTFRSFARGIFLLKLT